MTLAFSGDDMAAGNLRWRDPQGKWGPAMLSAERAGAAER